MGYLMEDQKEGSRVRDKTEKKTTIEHLNVAGLTKGMLAVDIGCASGEVTRQIEKTVSPAQTLGFDLSQDRINEARSIDAKEGFFNIQYIRGDVYDIGLKDNTFDFVWCRFLFEYLKEPLMVLSELKRIVKPGGKVVVADIDGNCVFHYPMKKEQTNEIYELVGILHDRAGFDPFVGRKLYTYFSEVGFRDIKTDILPYHVITGEPSEEDFALWERKISVLSNSFSKFAPDEFPKKKHVLRDFLEFIKRPDTTTYSVIFIVQGTK